MHPYMSQNPQTPMNLGYTPWQLELSHVHTYLCITELEDKECACIWDSTKLGPKHADTEGWNWKYIWQIAESLVKTPNSLKDKSKYDI